MEDKRHPTEVDAIASAIVQKMKEEHHTLWIDPELHAKQHAFLSSLIAEREEKLARRKRIEDRIAGSVLLSAVLALLGVVGAGLLDLIRTHLK